MKVKILNQIRNQSNFYGSPTRPQHIRVCEIEYIFKAQAGVGGSHSLGKSFMDGRLKTLSRR